MMASMNKRSLSSFSSELAKTSASIGVRKLIKTVGNSVGGRKMMISTLGDATVGTAAIRNKAYGVGSGNQVAMLQVNPHFQRMGMAPKMLGDSAKKMKGGRLWGDYHFSDGGRAAANSAIKKDSARRAQGKGGITFKQGGPMSKRGDDPADLWSTKDQEAHYYKQIPESGPRPKTDLFDKGGSYAQAKKAKGPTATPPAVIRQNARMAQNRRPSPESIRQAIKDSGIKRKPMPKPRASTPSPLDPRLGNMDAAHTPKQQGVVARLRNNLTEFHRRRSFAAAEKKRADTAAKRWPKTTESQKAQRQERLEELREKYYQKHKKWVGKPPSVLSQGERFRGIWG